MKKIILFSALCLFLTTISFAGKKSNAPDPGFSIIQNGTVLKVLYKGSKPGNVKVSILDSNKQKVFSELLKQTEGFARPYNMENLPEGEYVVELSDEFGAARQTVVIEDKKAGKGFHIEKVHGYSDKVLFMAGKNSKGFELRIVDHNGRTVYTESRKLNKDFAQVYNLAPLEGHGTVYINDFNGHEQKFDF